VFVFDVISLPFSFPVGDVSDDDDAVTDVILFSCIFIRLPFYSTSKAKFYTRRRFKFFRGVRRVRQEEKEDDNNKNL
jgi:hypothetical protein